MTVYVRGAGGTSTAEPNAPAAGAWYVDGGIGGTSIVQETNPWKVQAVVNLSLGDASNGAQWGSAGAPIAIISAAQIEGWGEYVASGGASSTAAYFGSEEAAAKWMSTQAWYVDGEGGIQQETNAWKVGDVASASTIVDPSTGDFYGSASSPIAVLGPGQAMDWGEYVKETGDKTMAAYFTSEDAAYQWESVPGNVTISSGNAFQQTVQGIGDTAKAIGNDFANGNVGAGVEGIFGVIVDSTLIGQATGAGTTLLQGAGATSAPARKVEATGQGVATGVEQAGEAIAGATGQGAIGAANKVAVAVGTDANNAARSGETPQEIAQQIADQLGAGGGGNTTPAPAQYSFALLGIGVGVALWAIG